MLRTIRPLFIALAATLAASASTASAHVTDLDHWFEHERARTDGNVEPQPLARAIARPANGGLTSAVTAAVPRGASAPRDCFVEELKRSEGYVPLVECLGGRSLLAEEHWTTDEDKEHSRRAERSR